MQKTRDNLSARVTELQQEVNDLKEASAKDATAWGERMQSEMAQQRRQNEALRVQMQQHKETAELEQKHASSQLTVLSRQHHLALASKDAEQKALQTALQQLKGELTSLEHQGCIEVEAVSAEMQRIDTGLVRVRADMLLSSTS
jgi:chromosome segregation ATPase